jgi:hypothetical protein
MIELPRNFDKPLLPDQKEQPQSITISIPCTHPGARRLVALFERLQTYAEYESGLVIESAPSDAKVNEFMAVLREVVEELGGDFDQLMSRFEKPETVTDLPGLMSKVMSSRNLGGLLFSAITQPRARDKMDPRIRRHYINMTEKMLDDARKRTT